jgi:hypothetical protein
MTTLLIASLGSLALIVVGCFAVRRYALGRGHEKAAADDALRELYGQYWAEVRTVTQTHLLEAPADEEWLAGIRERALHACSAEEVSGTPGTGWTRWPLRRPQRVGAVLCGILVVGLLVAGLVAVSPIFGGALAGFLVGMVLSARYLRQEMAAKIGPRLQHMEQQLHNLRAEVYLNAVTRLAERSRRSPGDPPIDS